MKKIIPGGKIIKNSYPAKRINSQLKLRFSRYKEVGDEEYIGGNGSVYYNVIKLEAIEKQE